MGERGMVFGIRESRSRIARFFPKQVCVALEKAGETGAPIGMGELRQVRLRPLWSGVGGARFSTYTVVPRAY